jgi:hypothetical protein
VLYFQISVLELCLSLKAEDGTVEVDVKLVLFGVGNDVVLEKGRNTDLKWNLNQCVSQVYKASLTSRFHSFADAK